MKTLFPYPSLVVDVKRWWLVYLSPHSSCTKSLDWKKKKKTRDFDCELKWA